MRVLVTGDRNWQDVAFLFRALDDLNRQQTVNVVIEGAAPGADTAARQWAEARGIPVQEYPALWKQYGRAAGPVRNRQMIEEGHPTIVVAFHPDLSQSKGTADMVRQARKAGLEMIHYTGREQL